MSDTENVSCIRQEIAEAEEDYRKVSKEVQDAETELRRLQTEQRRVVKEGRKEGDAEGGRPHEGVAEVIGC